MPNTETMTSAEAEALFEAASLAPTTPELKAALRKFRGATTIHVDPEPDDFIAIYSGSIVTLRPLTEEAKFWVEHNLPDDFNGAIEARYFGDIRQGIEDEGLTFA